MVKSYEEVIAGYKKSIQALKLINKEKYDEFCSLFERFDKDDLDAFFKSLEISAANPKALSNSQSVIEVKQRNERLQKSITLYYGTSLDLKLEMYVATAQEKAYKKYTLCALVEDISNFDIGAGTVFFKETKIINGKHCKNYYAIAKAEDGYKLFTQTHNGEITNDKLIKNLLIEDIEICK